MSLFDDDAGWRRRKNPFDFFDTDDEFERISRQIEHIMNRIFREFNYNWIKPGSSFIHGFNIHIGPDGRPHIEQFGNRPLKKSDGEHVISDEREPLTDIIEGNEDVAVTVEIPGVEKEDIDVNVTEQGLEIKVDNPQRKYYKHIDFPCDVLPKTTKATYKNGVLDIIIKRKERKKDEGYRVEIE
ncbi:MAG: Hsp20/alpha crystallin family protein [Candidatus Thermoplasmatota archaeon]|jgi:HSP20 family protein|nr:Hsp20/alpha crystallin family protein [Candidatus Thermoplasmatota archaeon]